MQGIYRITCYYSGLSYIGSAVDIRVRWGAHRRALRRNRHHSIHLQNAWNKYGESAFEFLLIEIVENKEELLSREQWWLDRLDTYKNGYNCTPLAGSHLGRKASDESRKKMSLAQLGKKRSPEHCRRISEGRLGLKLSEATKAKISASHRTPEAIARTSALHLGRKRPPETGKRISEAVKGKKRKKSLLKTTESNFIV